MRISGTQIGILFLLFIFTACQKEEADYVAQIDGKYEVSKQELKDYYKELYFGRRFPDSEYKGYGKALDEVITKKLKQIDFINRGYHKDRERMSDIQRIISEELLVRYFDEEYLGQYITDEVIEDYYQGLGRKVSYQQIVLNKNNAENLKSLQQKAAEIKQKAENTDDFLKLADQYAEAESDGIMHEMTWQQGTASAKNQVIFRMPEGTVRVLETTNNILIVKINNVIEVELRPLEEIRPRIYTILREVYSTRSFADYDKDKADLLDKNQYEWNKEGVNQLVEWAQIEGFYTKDKYKQIIEDSLEAGNNFEILKYENGTVDLQKYLHLLNNVLLIKTSDNATADDFKQFIDEALRTELIVEKAREMELDEDILSMHTNSPVILDEYVRLYDKEFIFSRIPEKTAENYQTFYEQTKDSLFYQPHKVNLRVKVFDTKEEAQDVIDEINKGKKFEDIFRAWLVKTYIINKKGEIESYQSNEPNYFGEEAFKLSEGETAGPIKFEENQKTKFAVIKANNVVEEKTLELDDVHPKILRRIFNEYYFNKFSKEVAEDLRNKYEVEINEQALVELSEPNQQQ